MNEKEKLEQPKLVEVEESLPEVVESSSQCAEVENTPETSEPASAPAKPEVAAYGDLEEVSSVESGRALETIPDEFKEILVIDRIMALLIDNAIVSTIVTIFFMSVMFIVEFTGGDPTSQLLSQLQASITGNQLQCFFTMWLITFFNYLAPGIAFLMIVTSLFLSSASFDIFLFVALTSVTQIAYQTSLISGKRQASIGKWIAGFKVVAEDGSSLGLGRVLLRECISCFELFTFRLGTLVYFLASDCSNYRPLHDRLTRSMAVKRKYVLSALELAELLPFGLALVSIAFLFIATTIYEVTYGKIADAKQVETARSLFGEGSESHLRQLWLFTKKRIEAGDYKSSFATRKDHEKAFGVISVLSSKWGNRDSRVSSITKLFLTNSLIARFPDLRESALKIAIKQTDNHADSDNFTPYGDLCLLYLAKAKSQPVENNQDLYKTIYEIGKSKLTHSDNKVKLLAAYMCAMDALGLEYELSHQIPTYEKANYRIEDCDALGWSYWDYRLFQLLLAENYLRDHRTFEAEQMISDLSEWESQAGHEKKLQTPRSKPNPIEEKTIENLSREFPRLAVQLKPSYWKYSQ